MLGILFRSFVPGALALALAACGDDIGGPGGPGGPGTQTGTLIGLVRDAETGDPIEGANLTVSGRQGETDGVGQFTISNVPTGRRLLTASMTGYLSQSIEITVRTDDNEEVIIELEPSS